MGLDEDPARAAIVLPRIARDAARDALLAAGWSHEDSDRDAAICYESQGLPLARVAAAIIDHRPEYAQAAQRLHTRTDIEWTPMD